MVLEGLLALPVGHGTAGNCLLVRSFWIPMVPLIGKYAKGSSSF